MPRHSPECRQRYLNGRSACDGRCEILSPSEMLDEVRAARKYTRDHFGSDRRGFVGLMRSGEYDEAVDWMLDEIERQRAEIARLTGEISAAAVHITMALLPALRTTEPGDTTSEGSRLQ